MPLPAPQFDAWVSQQEVLRTQMRAACVVYWKSELLDAPAYLPLPRTTGRWHAANAGSSYPLAIDATIARAIETRAKELGTTPTSVLLAAYSLALGKLAACDDLVIGVPTSGRTKPSDSSVVGYCANLLPLRVKLPANASIADAVHQASTKLRGALCHQELSLGEIDAELKVERRQDRSPLVQVAFSAFSSGSSSDEVTSAAIGLEGADWLAERSHLRA